MWFARVLAGVCALGAAVLPAVCGASPASARSEIVVRGRIAAFDGRYALTLRESSGRYADVRLKHGTVIDPRGRRLRPGMPVVVRALRRSRTLLALRIDDLSQVVAMQRWHALLQRYRRAQYLRARTAADRLAEWLERMYAVSPPRPAARPPASNVRRTVRPLAASDPQEIQPTWYGWGKL